MARVRGCDVWCGREDESVGGGGIRMGGCAVVYKAVCMSVRDLRSGDDGDHLGGARNQESAVARPTSRQLKSARAPTFIFHLRRLRHTLASRGPFSLSELNLSL